MLFSSRKNLKLIFLAFVFISCGDDKSKSPNQARVENEREQSENPNIQPPAPSVVPNSAPSAEATPTPIPDQKKPVIPESPERKAQSSAVQDVITAKDDASDRLMARGKREQGIMKGRSDTEMVDVEWALRGSYIYTEFLPTFSPASRPVSVSRTVKYRIEITKFSFQSLAFSIYKDNQLNYVGTAFRQDREDSEADKKNDQPSSTMKYKYEDKGYFTDRIFAFDRDQDDERCLFVYREIGAFSSRDVYKASGTCEI